MPRSTLTREERLSIDRLVRVYESSRRRVSLFLEQLTAALSDSSTLSPYIHSIKTRLKDSKSLRDKLRRKLSECKEEKSPFGITVENLLVRINDLAGIRILHLYPRQIKQIDEAIREIIHEQQYELIEGPFARTWDDESREFFKSCGIKTQDSPSLYTSVHYVVGSASRTKVTCEIQVRTLMEEVWGEVDHSMNYPHSTDSLACREQLKVLARVTSSATRLVDSIFLTLEDHVRSQGIAQAKSAGKSVSSPRPRKKSTKKAARRRGS
jgi:ppGpp synthetase/RelA/SpoT-type nucleotidyltranferase